MDKQPSDIIKNNPGLMLLVGMCPLLAITTSVINAISLGVCTCIILICSKLAISLLRPLLPSQLRLVSYIIIIAGLVSIIDMLMQTFFPSLSEGLGIFIPLIAVNCIILTRTDIFASKSSWLLSALDGLYYGLFFFLALFILASFREILGSGSFVGIPVFSRYFQPLPFFALPAGGFILLGILLAFFSAIKDKFSKTKGNI